MLKLKFLREWMQWKCDKWTKKNFRSKINPNFFSQVFFVLSANLFTVMIQALVKIANCALILLYFHDKQRHIPKKIKFLENNHSIKKEFSEKCYYFFAFPIFCFKFQLLISKYRKSTSCQLWKLQKAITSKFQKKTSF